MSYPAYDWWFHIKLTFSWKRYIYRSMATTNSSRLNVLYTRLAPGTPLTSLDLAALGISADLAVHYVRAGWLKRLARGVFCRPNDPPALHPSLLLLQRQFEGLHVGGKSALDWYGVRQYVAQQPVLHLYGWKAARLPEWFTERFPAEYHRKRLFDEQPAALLHVGAFEKRSGAPQVSAPERALLELLSEVGVRQPLQEARELVESAYSLRPDVLRELLQHCTNVKTVRLCLQLGREASLPWAAKLDPAALPTGSDRPWVSRSADGLLVLKP
ncbi:MAG: type IV toxin-antitoxin system AbiEi family antitoxin domain-containing protein [Stenotrophomonas sp.]